MGTVAFESRQLPPITATALRAGLMRAHERQPFSPLEPRETVRRVAAIAAGLGLCPTVYRGGLDLRGSEIDHLWLDVDGRVVDVAFPLFAHGFVSVLRAYVAGDVEADDVAAAAEAASVDQRVVGLFPAPLRYCGQPVWSARH